METETTYLLSAQSDTLTGSLVALLGFILYWGIMIEKKRSEKKEHFVWDIWWTTNWFSLILSFISCLAVFIATHFGGYLTYDRCLMIGWLGSFLIDRLKKTRDARI